MHVMQSGQWPDADNLRQHFQEKKAADNGNRRPKRRERNVKPGFNKIEWGKHRESNATHAMNECFITEKNAGHDQADQISGQDRFALRSGCETTEKNKTKKMNFTSGSLTRVAPNLSIIPCVHVG